jgi:hypothetical protein
VCPQFGGDLLLYEPGNPGYAMQAYYTGGSSELYALAPDDISGDLTSWPGVRWDEFPIPRALEHTSLLIVGADGTAYKGIFTIDQIIYLGNGWRQQFVPFDYDSGLWSLIAGTGSAPFNEVIGDVAGFYMQMKVAPIVPFGQAIVDNIVFVPEPTTLSLLALGSLALLRRRT